MIALQGENGFIRIYDDERVETRKGSFYLDEVIAIGYDESAKSKNGHLQFKLRNNTKHTIAFDRENEDDFYNLKSILTQRYNIREYRIQIASTRKNKKQKMNMCLLISFVLGALYMCYLIWYFYNAMVGSTGINALSAGLATALVTPHMIFVALAVIFNGIALATNKAGFALTGAIMYTIAMVIFLLYFFFVIIQMILSYIGYSQLHEQS